MKILVVITVYNWYFKQLIINSTAMKRDVMSQIILYI